MDGEAPVKKYGVGDPNTLRTLLTEIQSTDLMGIMFATDSLSKTLKRKQLLIREKGKTIACYCDKSFCLVFTNMKISDACLLDQAQQLQYLILLRRGELSFNPANDLRFFNTFKHLNETRQCFLLHTIEQLPYQRLDTIKAHLEELSRQYNVSSFMTHLVIFVGTRILLSWSPLKRTPELSTSDLLLLLTISKTLFKPATGKIDMPNEIVDDWTDHTQIPEKLQGSLSIGKSSDQEGAAFFPSSDSEQGDPKKDDSFGKWKQPQSGSESPSEGPQKDLEGGDPTQPPKLIIGHGGLGIESSSESDRDFVQEFSTPSVSPPFSQHPKQSSDQDFQTPDISPSGTPPPSMHTPHLSSFPSDRNSSPRSALHAHSSLSTENIGSSSSSDQVFNSTSPRRPSSLARELSRPDSPSLDSPYSSSQEETSRTDSPTPVMAPETPTKKKAVRQTCRAESIYLMQPDDSYYTASLFNLDIRYPISLSVVCRPEEGKKPNVVQIVEVIKNKIQRDVMGDDDYLEFIRRKHLYSLHRRLMIRFPGLIHFIYVDRTTNRMMSPKIDILCDSKTSFVYSKEQLKASIWDLIYMGHKSRASGKVHSIVSDGEFQYCYKIWAEDQANQEIPLDPLPLEAISQIELLNHFAKTKQRVFELYTLYMNGPLTKTITRFNADLVQTLRQEQQNS